MLHICMDDSPRFTWIEMDEVDSTNDYLRHYQSQQTGGQTLVTAEYQTAGHGQAGNTWEAERGRNLLFSIRHYPRTVEAREVFILSQAVALGVLEGAAEVMGGRAAELAVKWPNDIYLGTRKLAGILIETELMGSRVESMVAGVGLNVNQAEFVSDAPNPVSLRQALGHELERRTVLEQVVGHLQRRLAQADTDRDTLRRDYTAWLYRRHGYHRYRDARGDFDARFAGIEPDGHLLLCDTQGRTRRYAFKEVQTINQHTT